MASFPDRFHRDNAALLRCASSFSYILSLVSCRADVLRRGFFQEKSLVKIETGVLWYAVPASKMEGPCPDKFGFVQFCWLFCCNKRPGQGRTLCPGLSARCGGVSPPSCAPRSRPPSCPAGSRRARHPWRSCGRCGASGAGSCWWP